MVRPRGKLDYIRPMDRDPTGPGCFTVDSGKFAVDRNGRRKVTVDLVINQFG